MRKKFYTDNVCFGFWLFLLEVSTAVLNLEQVEKGIIVCDPLPSLYSNFFLLRVFSFRIQESLKLRDNAHVWQGCQLRYGLCSLLQVMLAGTAALKENAK